ncbi:MAG TPA: hypothetical protein VF459_05645 [Caulobacteraceae bacterium]
MKHRQLYKYALLGAVAFAASLGLASASDRGPGTIALPAQMVASASAFASYMDQAGGVRADFHDADSVHQRLKTGVSYEPAQFEEGMIAYGALVALQDGAFIDAVARVGNTPEERESLAAALEADPTQALRFDSAGDAAREVESALMDRAGPVSSAGKAVKQAAYDIQHQAWSKDRVVNLQGRLREVKSLSSTRYPGADGDGARLSQAMLQLPQPGPGGGSVSPVVSRSLALAAVAVLGEAKPDDLPRLQPLLSEYYSADCINMAKLNLYQCMAVAEPNYENVFCLGQHALIDTGQCVSEAVTASPNRYAPPPRVILASTAPVKAPAKAAAHRRHRRRS